MPEMPSTTYMQTKYEHEDDTEDVPEGVKPINQLDLQMAPHKKGETYLYRSELLQHQADDKLQDQADEIQLIMDQQKLEDATNLQLSYNHISHADDTEDIADEVGPSNYDLHHSKAWNEAVDKKAQELENEMKIEENMKISKKKAKEDAKKKAIEAKAKAEAEQRKKAQELAE